MICVALALDRALDIAAARRLHDYGALEDGDVARACEQTRMQRCGETQFPDYLTRVTAIACVIDDAGEVQMIGGDGHEAGLLASLADQLPERVDARIEWDGRDSALLATRALLLDRVLPDALRYGTTCNLAEAFGVRADGLDDETDVGRIIGLPQLGAAFPSVCLRATNRYRLWLRWQASLGQIQPGARAARERALDVALAGRPESV